MDHAIGYRKGRLVGFGHGEGASLWRRRLVLLASILLAGWLAWDIPLNNDISWQYWIARQLRCGALLYRDIVEVNPPLWFWEAIPLSALADRLQVATFHIVIIVTLLRAGIGLALTAHLLRAAGGRCTAMTLIGLAAIFVLLPIFSFAEREHLLLFGAMPYAMLLAARAGGKPVAAPVAGFTGLFAGYAFALKPHFLLVPIALELWLIATRRRDWRPLRPETIAIGLVMLTYGAALLAFAADYFDRVLPMVLAAYGAFAPPLSDIFLNQIWLPSWILALIALLSAGRGRSMPVQAALVLAAALALSYVWQGKGFPYHAIAVTAALGWALWLSLCEEVAVLAALLRRPLAAGAFALMIATAAYIGVFHPARAGAVTDGVKRLPEGSTVAVVSAHSWLAFPLVEDKRFLWPSRWMSLWAVPMIAREGMVRHPSARGMALRHTVLAMLADDLWCHPPDAILFDDPDASPALAGLGFDYVAFVRSDPRLAALLNQYGLSARSKGAALYLKRGTLAPRGRPCRAISIRPAYD